MKIVGLDIGTNYTKATMDGEKVTQFPSIVVYGDEKDWTFEKENKDTYVGQEALEMVQNMENVEAERPLHEGRIMSQSYIELAKHAFKTMNIEPEVIATGMPVKSSKNEREELKNDIKEHFNAKAVIYPEPVGTLAQMNIQTGVCVDIGFGTTDIAVLHQLEYVKGDTLLQGVDWLHNNLEVIIRKNYGIGVTPEEITKLLTTPGYEIGRVRSGKTIKVSHEEALAEYNRLVNKWLDRIVSRTKSVIEGLSTEIVDQIVLTGGGSLLPGVYDEFKKSFQDIADVVRPQDPVSSNVMGYYILSRSLFKQKDSRAVKTSVEETKQKRKDKEKVEKKIEKKKEESEVKNS
ncbi:MAG: rod shape-determining protein [Archaeoglobaceae archaeon]